MQLSDMKKPYIEISIPPREHKYLLRKEMEQREIESPANRIRQTGRVGSVSGAATHSGPR